MSQPILNWNAPCARDPRVPSSNELDAASARRVMLAVMTRTALATMPPARQAASPRHCCQKASGPSPSRHDHNRRRADQGDQVVRRCAFDVQILLQLMHRSP